VPEATTRRPSIVTVPPSGRSNPAISRRSVVFPQPDGPSNATTSPRSTHKEAPSTAGTSPKRFVTPSIRIIEQSM